MALQPEAGVVGRARSYAGPTEVASAFTPEQLPPSVTPPTPPKTDEAPDTPSEPWNPGARWRFAYVVSTHLALGEDIGLGFGIYVGAGVPSKSKIRARHSFGYAGELTFGLLGGAIDHRHRAAASGTAGRRRPGLRRVPSFYYYAAFGASVYGTELAGPSLGARIGFASSRDLDYILAIGGDLDVFHLPGSGQVGVVPTVHFSLLTFGSL